MYMRIHGIYAEDIYALRVIQNDGLCLDTDDIKLRKCTNF